jgi:hypothetical protein
MDLSKVEKRNEKIPGKMQLGGFGITTPRVGSNFGVALNACG